MIYVCLRFIEEWAHPLTIVNFTLIGLSSGPIAERWFFFVQAKHPQNLYYQVVS